MEAGFEDGHNILHASFICSFVGPGGSGFSPHVFASNETLGLLGLFDLGPFGGHDFLGGHGLTDLLRGFDGGGGA